MSEDNFVSDVFILFCWFLATSIIVGFLSNSVGWFSVTLSLLIIFLGMGEFLVNRLLKGLREIEKNKHS